MSISQFTLMPWNVTSTFTHGHAHTTPLAKPYWPHPLTYTKFVSYSIFSPMPNLMWKRFRTDQFQSCILWGSSCTVYGRKWKICSVVASFLCFQLLSNSWALNNGFPCRLQIIHFLNQINWELGLFWYHPFSGRQSNEGFRRRLNFSPAFLPLVLENNWLIAVHAQ